jgi:ribosome biogenesis GTPase
MRARELGPKSVVTGDNVSIVGDVTGSEGSLARIVAVQDRRNSLSRTVDDAAQVERTIVANIDQLVIVVAAANPEPRRGLIDRFLVSALLKESFQRLLLQKLILARFHHFSQSMQNLILKSFTLQSKVSHGLRI